MSEDRKMTPKGFLHKAKIAKSALAFFAAHRDYMLTGELAPITAPILEAVEAKAKMPTPALSEMIQAVFSHNMVASVEAAKRSQERSQAAAEKPPENYTVRVLSPKGETLLEEGFEMPQRAEDFAARRLANDCEQGCIAQILHLHSSVVTTMDRDQAVERVFGRQPGHVAPTCQRKSTSTPRLGFGVKVRNDVARFSRG
jgi:hypothetical protein